MFTQDVRFALRMLAKSPAFSGVAVLTLALGIGVNSSLFSIASAGLLEPLPYPRPDRLTAIYQRAFTFEKASITYLNFLDWQARNRTFASMAAFRSENFNLTSTGESLRLRGEMISSSYFPTLGVEPILGAGSHQKRIASARRLSRSSAKGSGSSRSTAPITRSWASFRPAFTWIDAMTSTCPSASGTIPRSAIAGSAWAPARSGA
jgi:hypothetical protein